MGVETALLGRRLPQIAVSLKASKAVDFSSRLGRGFSLILGVPGAFESEASEIVLPLYKRLQAKLNSLGVGSIVCVAVNDQHVLKAWARSLHIGKEIVFLSDPKATLIESLGMTCDAKTSSKFGGTVRSRFFALLVRRSKPSPSNTSTTATSTPTLTATPTPTSRATSPPALTPNSSVQSSQEPEPAAVSAAASAPSQKVKDEGKDAVIIQAVSGLDLVRTFPEKLLNYLSRCNEDGNTVFALSLASSAFLLDSGAQKEGHGGEGGAEVNEPLTSDGTSDKVLRYDRISLRRLSERSTRHRRKNQGASISKFTAFPATSLTFFSELADKDSTILLKPTPSRRASRKDEKMNRISYLDSCEFTFHMRPGHPAAELETILQRPSSTYRIELAKVDPSFSINLQDFGHNVAVSGEFCIFLVLSQIDAEAGAERVGTELRPAQSKVVVCLPFQTNGYDHILDDVIYQLSAANTSATANIQNVLRKEHNQAVVQDSAELEQAGHPELVGGPRKSITVENSLTVENSPTVDSSPGVEKSLEVTEGSNMMSYRRCDEARAVEQSLESAKRAASECDAGQCGIRHRAAVAGLTVNEGESVSTKDRPRNASYSQSPKSPQSPPLGDDVTVPSSEAGLSSLSSDLTSVSDESSAGGSAERLAGDSQNMGADDKLPIIPKTFANYFYSEQEFIHFVHDTCPITGGTVDYFVASMAFQSSSKQLTDLRALTKAAGGTVEESIEGNEVTKDLKLSEGVEQARRLIPHSITSYNKVHLFLD